MKKEGLEIAKNHPNMTGSALREDAPEKAARIWQ
jgi:hypothetical protein